MTGFHVEVGDCIYYTPAPVKLRNPGTIKRIEKEGAFPGDVVARVVWYGNEDMNPPTDDWYSIYDLKRVSPLIALAMQVGE